MSSLVKHPVFFVIGSTGTGKSKVAVRCAQELKTNYGYTDVVIINCDVYQCYDGLPIGTNKPTDAELGGVQHVFLSFLDSTGKLRDLDSKASPQIALAHTEALRALQNGGTFNVHTYEKMVTSFIAEYFRQNENAAVVVCGGTCYYVQALLFSDSLVNDETVGGSRSSSSSSSEESEGDGGSDGTLWERLNSVDAEVASRYHPHDSRRIKRMLQIYRHTGQKPSTLFSERGCQLRFNPEKTFLIWTRIERTALDRALDSRVDEMVLRGILGEVRAFWLHFNGNPPHNSLSDAIGCKELMKFFAISNSAAEISDDDAKRGIEQVKANTRRYARQQERWIKNRLIRLLQLTPLKEQWAHFLVFPTGSGKEALSKVSAALKQLLSNPPTDDASHFLCPFKEAPADQIPVTQQKCGVCDLLVCGRAQMEVHLKSKRHRGALRRIALEKEQKELYGRELPPPKKKRSG